MKQVIGNMEVQRKSHKDALIGINMDDSSMVANFFRSKLDLQNLLLHTKGQLKKLLGRWFNIQDF